MNVGLDKVEGWMHLLEMVSVSKHNMGLKAKFC